MHPVNSINVYVTFEETFVVKLVITVPNVNIANDRERNGGAVKVDAKTMTAITYHLAG